MLSFLGASLWGLEFQWRCEKSPCEPWRPYTLSGSEISMESSLMRMQSTKSKSIYGDYLITTVVFIKHMGEIYLDLISNWVFILSDLYQKIISTASSPVLSLIYLFKFASLMIICQTRCDSTKNNRHQMPFRKAWEHVVLIFVELHFNE